MTDEKPDVEEFDEHGMPVEEAESATVEVAKPIYMTPGREGMAASRIRRLVTMVELPDRRKETFQARNLLAESDIREAMAKAAIKLHNHYLQKFSVLGFVFDPEAIEYDFQRLAIGMDIGADTAIKHTEGLARVIVASVVIRRD